MLNRKPQYYTSGYDGSDPSKAPFYLRALVFDGKEGDYNSEVIDEFNSFLSGLDLSADHSLDYGKTDSSFVPEKIIVVNALS